MHIVYNKINYKYNKWTKLGVISFQHIAILCKRMSVMGFFSSPLLGGYLYTELDGMSTSSTPAFCLLVKAPISQHPAADDHSAGSPSCSFLLQVSPCRNESYTSDGFAALRYLSAHEELMRSWSPSERFSLFWSCPKALRYPARLSCAVVTCWTAEAWFNPAEQSRGGTESPGSQRYAAHRVRWCWGFYARAVSEP